MKYKEIFLKAFTASPAVNGKTFERVKWFTVTPYNVIVCCDDENSKETIKELNIMDAQLSFLVPTLPLEETKSFTCPVCGKSKHFEDARFCTRCGTRLTEQEDKEPKPLSSLDIAEKIVKQIETRFPFKVDSYEMKQLVRGKTTLFLSMEPKFNPEL